MNRLTLLSAAAMLFMAVSSVSASVTSVPPPPLRKTTIMVPTPQDPRPPVSKFGTLVYSMRTESGNSLDLSLISATTIDNPDGTKNREFNIGFEFEDGTKVVSKFTVMPDETVVTDESYEYLASQISARPDLSPMLQQIAVGGTENDGEFDPGAYYTCGLATWLRAHACEIAVIRCMVAICIGDILDIGIAIAGIYLSCY